MKPKTNRKGDQNASNLMDRCETPAYAMDPLIPYLPKLRYGDQHIWEPACGSGRIVRVLHGYEGAGYSVIGTDVLQGEKYNFFEMPMPTGVEVIVTNPPYSCKPQFIRRCYELGKPFALLVPVETIGTGTVQRMMERHGAELLLLNKRVNFYMPHKGLDGNGAQFPVLWFCWRMLPAPLVYGKLTRRPDEQMVMALEAA